MMMMMMMMMIMMIDDSCQLFFLDSEGFTVSQLLSELDS